MQAIDAGTSIRLRVTATNSEGSVTALSTSAAVPVLSAPVVTSVSISPASGPTVSSGGSARLNVNFRFAAVVLIAEPEAPETVIHGWGTIPVF